MNSSASAMWQTGAEAAWQQRGVLPKDAAKTVVLLQTVVLSRTTMLQRHEELHGRLKETQAMQGNPRLLL